MTTDNHDQALEARARELLAAELDAVGFRPMASEIRDPEGDNTLGVTMVRVLVAAMREARVPEGFVLMPVEPTDEMLLAAVRQWDSTPADPEQIGCARDTYRAMLSVAKDGRP